MKIENKTHVSEELIKAIALDVGFDMRESAVLEIEYSTGINQGLKDAELGGFFSYLYEGTKYYAVKLAAISGTDTLAHELRHAYQCQAMGDEDMIAVYAIENEEEGYWNNILEVDAREAGSRWKV